MVFWVIIQIVVAIVLAVISVALSPKPKSATRPSATSQDLEEPTAEAGRPIPVIFGTITTSGANVLWFGDRNKRDLAVAA